MKIGRSQRRIFNLLHRSALLLLIACITVLMLPGAGNADSGTDKTRDQVTKDRWSIGYWVWRTSGARYHRHAGELKGGETGPLYVDAGSIYLRQGPEFGIRSPAWPKQLPKASVYFALLRVETTLLPPESIISKIVDRYRSLKEEASGAGQKLTGLQLDFDCPTERLEEYAHFLKQLRGALPSEDGLSITALLDWFRPGTKIGDLLQWVDEYVPQFYDLGHPGAARIASATESSKWAPIFNSYSKPYRVGIATFGRISEWCANEDKAGSGQAVTRKFLREYDSFELARENGLEFLSETLNQSGERVVQFNTGRTPYSACRDSREIIEMILPTRESVLAAYDSAGKFGGFCRGVVFFRWPSENEAMVLSPEEVTEIILERKWPDIWPTVEAEDGFCAAVNCANLYLRRSGQRFSPDSVVFRIHSSTDLEYFLPREALNAKMVDRRTVEVLLPAYLGDPRIYLGRAVFRESTTFSFEGLPNTPKRK